MPDTEKVPPDDPLAKVQHGDPPVCVAEAEDLIARTGSWPGMCRAADPMGVGLECTRYLDHPGQHIAQGETQVEATWPAAVTA